MKEKKHYRLIYRVHQQEFVQTVIEFISHRKVLSSSLEHGKNSIGRGEPDILANDICTNKTVTKNGTQYK